MQIQFSEDMILSFCLKAKLCPALCDIMEFSLAVSSAHGISQARILLLFPFPGSLLNPEIEPTSPALAGRFFTY